MIAKVILGTMTNARKLVSIAERISCDVELCSGRYVVNAKSMLGVLSMPEFEYGELHIHTDEENECNQVLKRLLEEGLLADTNDAAKRSLYDITTFGEILIDFTWQGVNEDGQTLFAQNPGGRSCKCCSCGGKTWWTYRFYREGRKGYAWRVFEICAGKRKRGNGRNASG